MRACMCYNSRIKILLEMIILAKVTIAKDTCKGCGLCIAKCPMNKAGKKCLQWSKEVGLYQTPAVAPDPEICIACGACAMTCPDSAIRIERKN